MPTLWRLRYTHPRNVRPDKRRGVCPFAESGECCAEFKQRATLILWWLPHTATKNSNWENTFGLLEWNGVFHTITTNPDPTKKSRRVLHPDNNRVVSVREFAQAQGFPDHYKLHGVVQDKYRQVGT